MYRGKRAGRRAGRGRKGDVVCLGVGISYSVRKKPAKVLKPVLFLCGIVLLASMGILEAGPETVLAAAEYPKAGVGTLEKGSFSGAAGTFHMLSAQKTALTRLLEEKSEESALSYGEGAGQQESADKRKEKSEASLIVVDAGHGGMDDGCLGGGLKEDDINLQIALLVRDKLEKKGFQVMMPREADDLVSKEDRVELANSYQADAYVSIHQNTYEGSDKSVGGIETWYDGDDDTRDSERLARLVHRQTVRSTGARRRGLIDSTDLYVNSKTLMPACLIETGFLSNPQECARLADPAYQEKLADGIVEGICMYFYTSPATETPEKLMRK